VEALRDVQTRFAAAVMAPLSDDWQMQGKSADGRPMADVAAEFIRPNDRLTSVDRLEIYNKQYWFRLIDAMYEDYAGIAAILGRERYNAFCKAYFTRYPSRTGMLRNIGYRLSQFVNEEPALTAPHTDMVLDMARFEWAQVEAFDAAHKPRLTTDDLLGMDPAKTRLYFQPSITLLELDYAVDRLFLAVKKQSGRSEASNASEGVSHTSRRRRSARAEHVFVVVHRFENQVYIKRLPAEAFAILRSLQKGATIAEAIEAAMPETADMMEWAKQIQGWFKMWMSWGWFCKK
jgi:hypothetical protein